MKERLIIDGTIVNHESKKAYQDFISSYEYIRSEMQKNNYSEKNRKLALSSFYLNYLQNIEAIKSCYSAYNYFTEMNYEFSSYTQKNDLDSIIAKEYTCIPLDARFIRMLKEIKSFEQSMFAFSFNISGRITNLQLAETNELGSYISQYKDTHLFLTFDLVRNNDTLKCIAAANNFIERISKDDLILTSFCIDSLVTNSDNSRTHYNGYILVNGPIIKPTIEDIKK